jgi:hypothetical protein
VSIESFWIPPEATSLSSGPKWESALLREKLEGTLSGKFFKKRKWAPV